MDAANLPDCWKAKTDPSARDPNTAFPLEGRDILNIPQAELISAAETAPALHDLQNNRVSRITRDLVIKSHLYTLRTVPPMAVEKSKACGERWRLTLEVEMGSAKDL
ncbi:uncharacterized protein K460DRAFT_358511 [Cucurbitaria berberidis CBS 394.84]|uniref:Uncharacterized protein n=1 Tax=Cucurbitaria berberidis CBS 394.84 TaxID=1168544 RepID=A0A9P4G9T9_9PLEO|nr:uncharacterized protein K460DRAFT_358511 [Cucurbitaria berberidis CBS 394.84]KAF1841813.1 hypothetical protein K460DRAFT_358511 [Cucurbitaria berberidis CBS 394.84]